MHDRLIAQGDNSYRVLTMIAQPNVIIKDA